MLCACRESEVCCTTAASSSAAALNFAQEQGVAQAVLTCICSKPAKVSCFASWRGSMLFSAARSGSVAFCGKLGSRSGTGHAEVHAAEGCGLSRCRHGIDGSSAHNFKPMSPAQ